MTSILHICTFGAFGVDIIHDHQYHFSTISLFFDVRHLMRDNLKLLSNDHLEALEVQTLRIALKKAVAQQKRNGPPPFPPVTILRTQ